MKLGILGGMGPLAGAYFYEQLVKKTPANKDQEHIETILYSNPIIPDRTDYIINGKNNPLDELIKSFKFFENTGCDEIIMICNTAYYFLEEIQKKTYIPILNIIENVGENIYKLGHNKVFLLGTEGTVKSNIYLKYFKKFGIEIELPNYKEQNIISNIIYYGIKKGKLTNKLKNNFLQLINNIVNEYSINNIILGCTELSILSNIIKKEGTQNINLFDPIEINSNIIINKHLSTKKHKVNNFYSI